MIKKIKRLLTNFFHRWIIDRDPREQQIENLHEAILYLWRSIDMAEYHHEFMIIRSDIDLFIRAFENHGFEDFKEIVEGIREHLSARIDQVQNLSFS